MSFWHKTKRGDAFLAPPLLDFLARGGSLHIADFGREEDAEAIADGASDALGKEGDLVAGGVAVVDDDERLVFVNADFTLAEAFESAALDEPAGGDFDAGSLLWRMAPTASRTSLTVGLARALRASRRGA